MKGVTNETERICWGEKQCGMFDNELGIVSFITPTQSKARKIQLCTKQSHRQRDKESEKANAMWAAE